MDALAKQSKSSNNLPFVSRVRKFTGDNFFKLLCFSGHFDHSKMSLNELAIEFYKHYQKSITKQGINKKFSPQAVEFIKLILVKLLKSINYDLDPLPINNPFGSIIIKDSTSFQLPSVMANKYRGSGGSASEACIKIQFEYDVINGKIIDLTLHPNAQSDYQNVLLTPLRINENDLLIRDLGYTTVLFIQQVKAERAFFVSRLLSGCKVYIHKSEKFEELSLKKLLSKMNRMNINVMDLETVYISAQKEQVRLILERMPDEIVKKRIASKKKQVCKQRRMLTEEAILLCHFNLFITNIPTEIWNVTQIHKAYQLRWQIELIFKTWKSVLEINKVNKRMKVERFECFLLAKLCWVIIHLKVLNKFNALYYKTKTKLLSYYKAFKLFKSLNSEIGAGIANNNLEPYFKMVDHLIHKCILEKRKDRDSFYDLLYMTMK